MGLHPSLLLVGVLLLGVAVYLNYPAPHPSPSVQAWANRGTYFQYLPMDVKVFYRDDKGTGDGGVLLCLHGFPSFSYDWYKVWPQLTKRFKRVIAPDFLGLGLSDKPFEHQYSIGEQADLVEVILTKLQVSQVHLLAHDYGDSVAQELLYRYGQVNNAMAKP